MLKYLGWSWGPLSGVLGLCLALTVTCHALLRRRDPRAVLLWIITVWLTPILGALAYYFMGINRIERRAAHLRRPVLLRTPSPSLLLSRSEDPNAVSPKIRHLQSLSRLVEGVVQLPLTQGNRVTPLLNGDQAYPAMLAAINEAQVSVSLATYIFNNDRAGKLFVEALRRAMARGVQVRVLIDDVGSGFGRSSIAKELTAQKIPHAIFLPTFAPWPMAYINLRNHRKMLVVDGKKAFTGGMNIHEGHMLALDSRLRCQDIQFMVDGPVVAQIQETFREDWFFTTGEVLSGVQWFPSVQEVGSVRARGLPDGPDEDFDKCRWTLLGALSNARESIRIVTPYFIPDTPLVTALNLAAMSGLQVDIVLPSTSDLVMVQWASMGSLWQVLRHGCRVWLTPPPFDHSKMMVVDGAWSLFGSTNWDKRSLRLNFEFNVECYDEVLGQQLDQLIAQKMGRAQAITMKDMNERSLPRKLRDNAARLFSPVL